MACFIENKYMCSLYLSEASYLLHASFNPFIARSGISKLREFPWDRSEFSDYARYKIINGKFHEIIHFIPNKRYMY